MFKINLMNANMLADQESLRDRKNRKKRLKFARDHLSWTSDDWSKVIWSDESPFLSI